ncbi:hypothetical protein KC19_2G271100 [Ceratodon purpureus]|uniref:Uncharacterized protein n=1 Tax=Ceratodon purpureus TaxID=3225 RepID=A0A8T0IYN7_CERPU|nr:hypothetical protein KC19_2G271100 [Ceratodon purpureus]
MLSGVHKSCLCMLTCIDCFIFLAYHQNQFCVSTELSTDVLLRLQIVTGSRNWCLKIRT